MRIHNVVEIHDNGEFVTLVTETGSTIHLPMKAGHSITVCDTENPADSPTIVVNVDMYQE